MQSVGVLNARIKGSEIYEKKVFHQAANINCICRRYRNATYPCIGF